ncbi:MAG: hypothetical protein JRJ13_12110 [Deltaproteobacteria bacterium]|nr:hypothetical protein [Deltaproteobacteria bacterium]
MQCSFQAWTFLSDGDALKKGMLDLDRVNIKSKTGELKGYMKKAALIEDRVNIYDKNGNQKGWLEKDALDPEIWKFRESQ